MAEQQTRPFFFTFGVGMYYAKRFVVIHAATREQARQAMFAMYGREWAFDYDEAGWRSPRGGLGDAKDQAEAYGYTELNPDPDQWAAAGRDASGNPLSGGNLHIPSIRTDRPSDGEVALAIVKAKPPLTIGQKAVIDALEDARTEVYRHVGGDPAGNLIGEHDHEDGA